MFRSAALLLSGNAFSSLMLLAGNILIARLVSVEDYGIATTLAVSMALVEMLSTLGLHQLIIQDRDGNDPKLQAALQAFHLIRAVLSAAMLFLLAHPIAAFLNIPDVAWAYQVIALVPLLNGLVHFDIFRLQRKMVFRPSILHVLVPAAVSLALVWPLFQEFGDYRVMLYAMIAQGIIAVLVSHFVAERAYRLAFDVVMIRRAIKFGWPLLINNVLLFSIFQGEKLIVGRELGIESLALFAMAFTLTLTPVLVLSRAMQSFFLPQLSAAKDDTRGFEHLATVTLQFHLALALIFVVGTVFLGDPLVRLLLGEKYVPAIPLLVSLAILQSLRLIKGANSTTALARGKTENAMVSNFVRTVLLSLSWYVAVQTEEIFFVVLLGIFGEAVSLVVSIVLVRYRVGLPLLKHMPVFLLYATGVLAAGLHAWPSDRFEIAQGPEWVVAVFVCVLAVSFWYMKDLRAYVAHRTVTQYED